MAPRNVPAPNPLDALLASKIGADPLTAALIAPLREAIRTELAQHIPRLTLTRGEAAQVLGVSTATVDRLLGDGQIRQVVQGKITTASVLGLAGWPMVPAPVAEPLAVVPEAGAA